MLVVSTVSRDCVCGGGEGHARWGGREVCGHPWEDVCSCSDSVHAIVATEQPETAVRLIAQLAGRLTQSAVDGCACRCWAGSVVLLVGLGSRWL